MAFNTYDKECLVFRFRVHSQNTTVTEKLSLGGRELLEHSMQSLSPEPETLNKVV